MPSRRHRSDTVRVVFLGDVVGQPGRRAVAAHLPDLAEREGVALTIANGENAAGGTGLTPQVIDELLDAGVDVITTGNHVWSKREIIPELKSRPYVIRPANYPPGAPGAGHCLVEADGLPIGIINLCGRVFMLPIDCPFRCVDPLVTELRATTPLIIVDMHAEATSEKQAMGWFLDGKVSAVVGTHTHVQTSDARVLPGGTAYVTDAGMTGPMDSVLGVRKEIIIDRFLTQLPRSFEVARKNPVMEGVLLEIERVSGKALRIEAFRMGETA